MSDILVTYTEEIGFDNASGRKRSHWFVQCGHCNEVGSYDISYMAPAGMRATAFGSKTTARMWFEEHRKKGCKRIV